MRLPADIDLDVVNGQRFTYKDAVDLLEDMRRLRRKSGWVCRAVSVSTEFVFELFWDHPEDDGFPDRGATFVILVRTVHRTFWPSLYPNDPSIDQTRRWFFERGGLHKIAAKVNETPQDTELPEEASALNRLLGDDDLDGI